MPFINLPITSRIYKNGIRISQVYNRDLSLWGLRDPHWNNLVFNFIDGTPNDYSVNNVEVLFGTGSDASNAYIRPLHSTGGYNLLEAPIPVPDNIQYTIDFIAEFITTNNLDHSTVDSTVKFYSIEYTNTGNLREKDKFKLLWEPVGQKFQFYENGNLREISFPLLKNTTYYISINRNTFDINDNQIKIFINGNHYPTNNDLLPRCPLIGTDSSSNPNTRFVLHLDLMTFSKLRFTKGSYRHWINYNHLEEIF